MVPKSALVTFFVGLCASVARADAIPTEPGPGAVFNAGSTCHIAWEGDNNSTTAWSNMSIELMTGSNFQMVHLTTVATILDGTVSGVFDYICPQVTPNSAIYFYQLTAPGTPNVQWTTRFAIASSSGQTTPPSESTQPGTGAAIPWGTGKLVDPLAASPPPAYLSDGGSSVANSTSTTPSASVTPLGTTSSLDTSPVASSTSIPTATSLQTSTTSTSPTATGTSTASNGASIAVGHSKVALVVLAASALVSVCIVSF